MSNPFAGIRLFEPEPILPTLRRASPNPFAGLSLFEAETEEEKQARKRREWQEAQRARRIEAEVASTLARQDIVGPRWELPPIFIPDSDLSVPEWEADPSTALRERRQVNGAWEYRPAPTPAEAWRRDRRPAGALPVEQMAAPKDPLKEMSLPEFAVGQVGARVKEGIASLLDIPEAAAEVVRSGAAPAGKGSVLGRLAPALNPLAPLLGALPEGALKPGGLVGGTRESVREDYERARADVQALGQAHPEAMQRLTAVAKIGNPALGVALAGQDPAAVGTALTETGLEAGGVGLDPTNAFPAGSALKGARRLGKLSGVAGETAEELVRRGWELRDAGDGAVTLIRPDETPVAEAMAHAASDVSPEAISRVQSGTRFWRVRPDGEVVPILNDVGAIDAPVARGELKVQTSPTGDVLVLEGRANAAQQRAVGQLREVPPTPPSPAVPAGLGEGALPLGEESLEGADDLLAQLGVRRGEGVERLAAREGAPQPFEGTVYHGSRQPDLEVVSARTPGKTYPLNQLGAFFAPAREAAEQWAHSGGKVFEAQLQLKNPKELPYDQIGYFNDTGRASDGTPLEAGRSASRRRELEREARALRAQLESEGHDGIIFRDKMHQADPVRFPVDHTQIVSFRDVPLQGRGAPQAAAGPPRPPLGAVESGAPNPFAPLRGGEPPIEAPAKTLPSPTIPMSTKALENVAGAKDEFHRLVQEHLPEIEAARGPVRPASVWHDAQELADRTGMALEDFLASPAGRTFDDREVSLAKSYMAGLQTRHATLDKAFGAMAEGVEKEAARDELAKVSVDLVKMMRIVQGGYSTAGRTLRSGQEALAAFAGSPKQRLQYALLQRYGAQNAEEAAQIEAKTIARLKRQATAEARAAKRVATVEELATEFEGLRSEFRSAMTRPRAGLDPELVGLVGRMAQNRVKAGIVEIEKIADEIYLFARDYVEGVTREDIKAAIVKATEPAPQASAEEGRLLQAEAATAKSIENLEARIAAGGAPPPRPTTSPWSSRLAELKAEQARLREQLAKTPGVENQKLRAAEQAASRSIADLEKRIASGNIAPRTAKPGPSSPELQRLRARQADLQKQIAELRRPKKTPEQAKLARMEAATQRQVKLLEERIAAGPKLPGQRLEVDSAKLQELRATAADLKRQIEADPREGLVKRYRELLDDQTVEMIAKLPDPETDPAALVNFLRHMEKPRFRDYRTSYWINSILSGTKTAIKNLNGNVVRLTELTLMRPAGAAVEQFLLAPLQKRTPERLVRETLPAMMGLYRGLPEAIKRFAFVMKEGYDPARLIAELTGEGVERWQVGRLPISPFLLSKRPIVRAAGVPLTAPTRGLESVDAMIKVLADTSERYAWATRKAIQENSGDVAGRVAELILEQPDEMVEAGRAFGKKATYQDPMSWIGRWFSGLRRGVPGSDELAERLRMRGGVGNRLLASGVQAPQTIMQHIAPFIHISDRVAASITDYIPLAKPFKLTRTIAAGIPGLKSKIQGPAASLLEGIPPDEAADLIARQVVGGVLGMLGLKWANEGRLVGEMPRDEKLRNDAYAAGKQPYSLLILGHYRPIRDVLGPWAGPFVAAAMYHDHLQVGEDPSEAVAGMALGSARYMLDASYMQTLQDVIQAVDQEATGQVGRGLTQAGARVASGYVPYSGLQRNIATAMDPRVVDKEGFLQEIQAGIPGLREDLPSRLDSLGNPIVSNTGFWGGFSPMVPTKSKIADPAAAERVERLRYTLQAKRREVGRIEAKVKDAEKAGDRLRAATLNEELPNLRTPGSPWPTAWVDQRLDSMRELEDAVRQLRADERMDATTKKAVESKLLAEMAALMEQTLRDLEAAMPQ